MPLLHPQLMKKTLPDTEDAAVTVLSWPECGDIGHPRIEMLQASRAESGVRQAAGEGRGYGVNPGNTHDQARLPNIYKHSLETVQLAT